MDEEVKTRLRFWMEKAGHVTNDHWVRFIIYWMIFDAYMTEESGEDYDSKRLKWFYDNRNEFKDILGDVWGRSAYQQMLEELRRLSPVYDMRPSHRDDSVSLDDINNINQVIAFIYQVRCNTFHGAKDLASSRDQQLVRISEGLLHEPLNSFLG
jgi:hypothetical protein